MAADHSQYLEDYFGEIVAFPGIPYFRLHYPSVDENGVSSADGEELMLAIHGASSDLLIISDQKILKYSVTKKKSFISRAFNFGVGFIPGVGETMDLVDAGKKVSNFGGMITGKHSRQAAKRKEEDLPSKKDCKGVYWNTNDRDVLTMILGYREHVLLANGFHWSVKFIHKFNSESSEETYLTIKPDGIYVSSGERTTSLKFRPKDTNSFNLLTAILADNHEIFEQANWQVGNDGQNLFLKKGQLQHDII